MKVSNELMCHHRFHLPSFALVPRAEALTSLLHAVIPQSPTTIPRSPRTSFFHVRQSSAVIVKLCLGGSLRDAAIGLAEAFYGQIADETKMGNVKRMRSD